MGAKLISILSLLLFVVFPLNMQMTTSSYGIFLPLSYLVYLIFWLFPIIYIYKNNKKWNNKYLILIVTNIALISLFMYFAERRAGDNCCHMDEYSKGPLIGNVMVIRSGIMSLYEKDGDYRKAFSYNPDKNITLEDVDISLNEKGILKRPVGSILLKQFQVVKVEKDCYSIMFDITTIPENKNRKAIKKFYIDKLGRQSFNVAGCRTEQDRCYMVFTEKGTLSSDEPYDCK